MRYRRALLCCLAITLGLAGCGGPPPPAGDTGAAATARPLPTSSLVQIGDTGSAPTATPPREDPEPEGAGAAITVRTDGRARPLEPRLLGTNVPAWLGPSTLEDPAFQALTAASGTTVLRLPGGTWSNHYDWLACETGDEEACYWPWAARPSDFINFLRATGREGMWTVSFNGTAKEAAALVAFFNGSEDDETPIGVDQRGRDWKTVGDWAALRAANGNPEPIGIKLWEVGNEIYGAKPATGGEGCADWGWEEVWTCDGTEYVEGKGEGPERNDGYLDFREAMRAVDPSILVGAVGVEQPSDWSEWGEKVIAGAGESMDFYVVHHYAYTEPPATAEEVLAQPQQTWTRVMRTLQNAFEGLGAGDTPVAITEYNLIAFQEGDSEQIMRRAVSALYMADTIGQMAEQGVSMANQWNLANGRAGNGTDYGLIEPQSGARNPAYYALALWGRMGEELLPVSTPPSLTGALRIYAGRGADGGVNLLVINTSEGAVTAPVDPGLDGAFSGLADTVEADTLLDEQVRYNGSLDPAPDLSDAPPQELGAIEGPFSYSFPAYSLTLIRLTPEQ